MSENTILPALPSSDPEALARNTYNGYYDVRSRDYWKDADISLTRLDDFKTCSHYFQQTGNQVQCTLCHVGFFGAGLHAQDGKLLANQQVIL